MMRYRAATPEEDHATLMGSDKWVVLQYAEEPGIYKLPEWIDVPFPEELDTNSKAVDGIDIEFNRMATEHVERQDAIDDTQRMVDVMLAWKSGESIQVRIARNGSDWLDGHDPVWNWLSNEYRVKPEGTKETKDKPMELWVNVYPNQDYPAAFRNKEAADCAVKDDCVTTLFRQVRDEE